MKLYVCWTTAAGGGHHCGIAYEALKSAGHRPEVVKCYGWGKLPGVFNFTSGRREAKRRTGSYSVPVLVLDDDTTIAPSQAIVDWARANPVTAAEPAAAPSG